jgi:plastocyanin
MRRLMMVIGAAAFVALGAGVSQAVIHDVEIHDFFFSPASLTVAVGDTVRWTQMGAMPHTVDQTDGEDSCTPLVGGFLSGTMMNGDTFVWPAMDVGEVYYRCAFHCPPMVAEVIVQDPAPVDAAAWGTIKALYR